MISELYKWRKKWINIDSYFTSTGGNIKAFITYVLWQIKTSYYKANLEPVTHGFVASDPEINIHSLKWI